MNATPDLTIPSNRSSVGRMNRHLLEYDPISHVSQLLDKNRAILDSMERSPPRVKSLDPAYGPEQVLARQRDVVENLERLLEELSNPAS